MKSLSQTKYKDQYIEFVKVLIFGVLSLLLSKVKFVVPGADGVLSDMREIALVISIFYFRRWYSVFFICLITGLDLHSGGSSYLATFSMHFVGLMGIYIIYNYIKDKIDNRFYLLGAWLIVGLVYFYVLMFPVMTVAHLILGRIEVSEVFDKYVRIAFELRFELILTTSVSGLYLMYLKTTDLLEKKNESLSQAMQKAEESERLKTAFLQNLSHEIRTPMNGIHGFSKLLMVNYESPEQTQQYCKHILQCSDQLLNIVNDIIDISQIETEQVACLITKNKIANMVSDVLLTVGAGGHYNLKRVVFDLEGINEDDSFETDFYKTGRILYHLIDNALKFSDHLPVNVSCIIDKGMITFTIEDYGVGIDKKQNDLIFKKFQQLEGDLTRRYGGNGLGLSIVDGFVKVLNGNISFRSEIEKGTEFVVSIPLYSN